MTGRRTLILLLAVGLLGLGVTSAPGEATHSARAARATDTAATSAATPLGGVNVPGLEYGSPSSAPDAYVAQAHLLHAKLLRTTVPWSVLTPSAPGRVNAGALAYVDRLVADARAAGMGVIMVVDSTPCWASSAPATLLRSCSTTRFTPANAWPPKDPSSYAQVVSFLAQRYRSGLTAIEVWNEPDHSDQLYFAGPEKPQRYAAILKRAYPAIKQANPRVLVLGGSLVGSNGVFLRDLYAAGIKGYYDGLAVHFYNLVLGSVRAIHEAQVAAGDSKPLWLDEFGWSTCYPRQRLQEEQACITPATQGPNLANVFGSLRHTPYVAAEVMYDLQDSGKERFGVLAANGARKPGFATLSKVLASRRGSAGRVTLTLRRRGSRILASGSGPVGDYMELETFIGGQLRYRALFVLDRFNRYSIALPSALGASGLQVRVYQYWAGARRGAQRGI